MESLFEFHPLNIDATGPYIFAAPLGDGAVPLIHLDDLGSYAQWILGNPSKPNGMDLEVATEHVAWQDLAKTLTAVIGKPAKYRSVTFYEYFQSTSHSGGLDEKLGHSAIKEDTTLLIFREIFTHDYAFLDESEMWGD